MILVVIIYKLYISFYNYICFNILIFNIVRLYFINIIYIGYIIIYEEVIYFEIKRKKEYYLVQIIFMRYSFVVLKYIYGYGGLYIVYI